jgi:hypothetical protein
MGDNGIEPPVVSGVSLQVPELNTIKSRIAALRFDKQGRDLS